MTSALDVRPPSAGDLPAPSPPLPLNRTLELVERQLRAIQSSAYDVMVLDAQSSEVRHLKTSLSLQEVLGAVPSLQVDNALDGEVLFRPSSYSQVTFLHGVSEPSLRRAEEHGLEPAVVIRSSLGQHEIWMRLPEALSPEEKAVVDRYLELDFQAAAPTPFPETEFGHLAGFSSPKAQKGLGLQRPPYPDLVSTSGQSFSHAPVLIAAARDEVTLGRLRARGEVEVSESRNQRDLFAAFERAYSESSFGASLPMLGSYREAEEAILRLSLAREGQAEAELRFSAAMDAGAGTPSLEESERLAEFLLNASRQARDAERPLEDLLATYPLPPQLELAELSRYAELRLATHEALDHIAAVDDKRDAPPAEKFLPDAPRPPAGALSAELAEFETSRGLPRSYEEGPDGLPIPRDDLRLVEQAEAALPDISQEGEQSLVQAYADAKATYDRALETGSPVEKALALQSLTSAEINLEGIESDLRRDLQVLTRAQNYLSEALAPLEENAALAPARYMPEFERHVHQLCAVEEAIGSLEPRLARLEAGRLDRDLARLASLLVREPSEENVARYSELYKRRLTFDTRPLPSPPGQLRRTIGLEDTRRQLEEAARHLRAVTQTLLRHPTERSLELFQKALAGHSALGKQLDKVYLAREHRVAQREIRATLSEISQYTRQLLRVPPQALDRFRDALALYNSAESAHARTVYSPPLRSGSPELARTLTRLRQGDLTPETLARLNRQLSNQLKIATGRMPAPEPLQSQKADLLRVIAANRRDRHALLRSARAASKHRKIHPPTLEHLQKALARYQSSSSQLNRFASEYTRGPLRRILPAAYFLDHPQFRRAPHRAMVAWTAHAVRQGLPASHAAEMMARTARSRLATPFVASRLLGGLAAGVVGRWLARLPERAMLEYVHDR